jgi:sporulation protein YlmC with PRC-barrel domain
MFRESELLGKEVISSDGEILGEVIEFTAIDDIPCMVVGDRRPLVSKERVLHSDKTVPIPYFEIEAVHDKIILKKSVEDILKEI